MYYSISDCFMIVEFCSDVESQPLTEAYNKFDSSEPCLTLSTQVLVDVKVSAINVSIVGRRKCQQTSLSSCKERRLLKY